MAHHDEADPAPIDGITPDDKDWTWVLERPCPECGFDAGGVARSDVARYVRAAAAPWPAVLDRPNVSVRPDPATWSAQEYAAHVRDCLVLFTQRLNLILTEDEPTFANWNQDETARESDYASLDPETLSAQVTAAGASLAAAYADVTDDQWERVGIRSNGSEFTVHTLGQYALHDFVHHLGDVKAPFDPVP